MPKPFDFSLVPDTPENRAILEDEGYDYLRHKIEGKWPLRDGPAREPTIDENGNLVYEELEQRIIDDYTPEFTVNGKPVLRHQCVVTGGAVPYNEEFERACQIEFEARKKRWPDLNIHELPHFSGHMGAHDDVLATCFTVWAPLSESVTLRLYHTDDPNEKAFMQLPLKRIKAGPWRTWVDSSFAGHGTYYDYMIEHLTFVTTCADPWGKAAGANGLRSMVSRVFASDPLPWNMDLSPNLETETSVIWETHIRDASGHPKSGVDEELKETYMSFHDSNSKLMKHLRRMGVSHVQLMPVFDFGSVDETQPRETQYNWGYDPVNYNVIEGSYSLEPHIGTSRLFEFRYMVANLHRNGFRVIMDVVYNHMYCNDNSFERVVPGYYCRRNEDGTLCNGSGCGNDMATEHSMFRRFIVESIAFWFLEFRVDGFRFDLMGLIDTETMRQIRAKLCEYDGGENVLLFGEPWSAAQTNMQPPYLPAGKSNTGDLDEHVGWFNDEFRDAVKGSCMAHREPGFVNGAAAQFRDAVIAGHAGRTEQTCVQNSRQLIQYVSSHDDLTLWDKLVATMREQPTERDYEVGEHTQDILAANAMAAGLTLTAAGIPFMLSGEEFARTKHGCANSYNQSAQLNQLDWDRAEQLSSTLVEWYQALIELRICNPFLHMLSRRDLAPDLPIVVLQVGSLILAANPTDTNYAVRAPEIDWEAIAGEIAANYVQPKPVHRNAISMEDGISSLNAPVVLRHVDVVENKDGKFGDLIQAEYAPVVYHQVPLENRKGMGGWIRVLDSRDFAPHPDFPKPEGGDDPRDFPELNEVRLDSSLAAILAPAHSFTVYSCDMGADWREQYAKLQADSDAHMTFESRL